jgi:hypothetical protein
MLSLITFLALVPSTPPESLQFDFWVGDWKCEGISYDAQGHQTKTTATNHVRRILKGNVIEEQFSSATLHGTSHSVFVPGRGWRQTWVDDQGGYIALAGSFADGKMTLETLPGGATKASRMVFESITPKSFDWRWEATTDGGKTWRLAWLLHYTRK